MSMKLHIMLMIVLVSSTMIPLCFAEKKGQSMVHELVIDGINRRYIVYKPGVSDTGGLPLMVVLHGGLGNASHMEKMTGMNDIADSGQFIVAYPDGTGGRLPAMQDQRTWNAGRCCGRAMRQNVNDVLFIKRVIEDIHTRYAIDTSRVYVTGMSNGAMMAYRLACEIPDKIAAIIPVSGTLAVDNCDSAKDIPVLHIHGDQDRNVPFDGARGEESVSIVSHRSVPDTINLVIRLRQCIASEKRTLEGNIQASSYRCSNGAPVELYVIKGGEHVWPGGHGRNNKESDGRYISASKVAWEFAKQFSKNPK
jgi:polyhydroxybutyrate depolymerase